MFDYLVSVIRTLVPVGVGALLGLLANQGIGISEADSAGLTAACIAITTSAYYALARAAETSRQPWLANIGRFLLGGVARTPGLRLQQAEPLLRVSLNQPRPAPYLQ